MGRPSSTNTEFELGGINHVALVCSDMARTVEFHSGVLAMPLIKALDLPDGMGQHFFFDANNGEPLVPIVGIEVADLVARFQRGV